MRIYSSVLAGIGLGSSLSGCKREVPTTVPTKSDMTTRKKRVKVRQGDLTVSSPWVYSATPVSRRTPDATMKSDLPSEETDDSRHGSEDSEEEPFHNQDPRGKADIPTKKRDANEEVKDGREVRTDEKGSPIRTETSSKRRASDEQGSPVQKERSSHSRKRTDNQVDEIDMAGKPGRAAVQKTRNKSDDSADSEDVDEFIIGGDTVYHRQGHSVRVGRFEFPQAINGTE